MKLPMFSHILQIGLLLFSIKIQITNSEVYSAVVVEEMEELIVTESFLITNLKGYIDAQKTQIDYVVKKLDDYQKEHTEAAADVSMYLSNPINAYLLTKRLTSDWKQLENLLSLNIGSAFLENITNYHNVLKFPSDEDLNDAAAGLMRLQDIYKLPAESIARGELNGIQYGIEMSSNDCFELGRQSYINENYYHTVSWMNEAMDRLMKEAVNETSSISKADILEYLAISTYRQGDVRSALKMANEILELMPNHEVALYSKNFYEKEISEMTNDSLLKGDDESYKVDVADFPSSIVNNSIIDDLPENKLYEMLCRSEIQPTPEQKRPLRCRYIDNNMPYLKIAPFKIEEVSTSPYIVVFHEVMYDHEIEVLKKMAKPKLRRTTVKNAKTDELEKAHFRVCKVAWLDGEDHKYIPRIVQRVQDMTGLDTGTSEDLQVVNYGIGGQYEPHYDFARVKKEKNHFKEWTTGNRIATVLFYMSDVEQGGATVFPSLRTAIFPKKGSAVFWYNLFPSGQGDFRTLHAACPVLTGSKWVSNIWIQLHGQVFIRKCDLEEESILT